LAALLDTHAFLWWCADDSQLSKRARRIISNEECFLSLASVWEIAIKVSQGRLELPSRIENYIPEQVQANGFAELEIGFRHIARCTRLKWHHRDPFDRLLAAQALEENVTMVSRDPVFDSYGVKRVW